MFQSLFKFASAIPAKVWGFICTAVAVLFVIWATFRSGKKQAKIEAKVEDLKEENAQLKEVTKTIQDDLEVVAEVRNDVSSLPSADLSSRADKWVRKPTQARSGSDQ